MATTSVSGRIIKPEAPLQLGAPSIVNTLSWLLFAIALLLAGCDHASVRWSEEVQLTSGERVLTERTARGNTFSQPGGSSGWGRDVEMTLAISNTATDIETPPEWRSPYAPVLLEYEADSGAWVIIATFYYCEGWYELGRPMPPYIQFRSINGGAWEALPVQSHYLQRQTNLLAKPRTRGESNLVTREEKELRQRRAGERFQRILSHWGQVNSCS